MKSTQIQQAGVTGGSQLVFILGHPLEHTLSPLMHNAAFRALGMPWVYAPMDIAPNQIPEALEALRSSNIQGANVTVPYKESVISHLDQVEKQARWLGSVNTIYRRGGKLLGASTDGEGFLRSLGPWRKRLKGSKGLLVGAGGAAKAVAEALCRSEIRTLWVANRSADRALSFVRSLIQRHRGLEVRAVPLNEGEKLLNRCDWMVQATPIGLKAGDPSPFSLKNAPLSTLVVDLIYHRETALLKEARRLRLPHLNGKGMLLHQGALSFEYWTGRPAPLRAMRKALQTFKGS
jgi:shikimate dehydrogenase